MSFGVFQNSIENSIPGLKTKCQPNVGNCICKDEFHSLLSDNINVITFGMDETGEKRTHKRETINRGPQNSYCKNRDTKAYMEVQGVVLKEMQEIGYRVREGLI